jgi:hypothetical protein
MDQLELGVHVIRQMGAFEHLVIFNATLELNRSGLVEIQNVALNEQSETDPEMVQMTMANIQAGIRSVLEPRQMGAQVQIHGLVIHPIDFIPEYYARYAQQKLEQLLQARGI